MKFIKLILLLIVFCCRTDVILAMSFSFNDQSYNKETEQYDYSETYEYKEPEANSVNKSQGYNSDGLFNFLVLLSKILLGIGVFVLLAYIGYQLLNKEWKVGNKKIVVSGNSTISIEEAEDINIIDLEELLRDALINSDFRSAIRIYYLMIIQKLDEKNIITYRKDKTNAEYLSDLSQHPLKTAFRQVTLSYERTWYGDIHLSENDFNHLKTIFSDYLQKITLSE
jgi:hypothetical protein